MNKFFPDRLSLWIGPLGTAVVAVAVVAVVVLVSGIINLAASIPHPEGWANLLHFGMKRAVAFHAGDLKEPDDFDADWRVAQGAAHYGHVCVSCHGAPELGQNAVVLKMRPRPQYLVESVDQLSNKELAWIVLHGVKYTAMPAWTDADREDEAWSMAAFLRKLPEMDYATYSDLAYGQGRSITKKLDVKFGDHFPDTRSPAAKRAEYRSSTPASGFLEFAMQDTLLPMCGRCHGEDGTGRGIGAFPNLAMQNEQYLKKSLEAYASGERHSGFMRPVATQLSQPQIEALAKYYASQPDVRAPGADKLDPALVEKGRQIAQDGVPSRNVSACLSCHEQTQFTSRVFPNLSGQYATYTENQLKLFAKNDRGNVGDYNPMDELSHALTDEEMKAVSAYFQSVEPGSLVNDTTQPEAGGTGQAG
ncbi:c-type cytochrome [Afifella aestuarii]|uniref:c-type cytochrome n=1 Tax=Afifella aestuarii TaxID=1909496 RepID=UPI000FE41439|nr:c-type cytochrome [Afifella aestuarii]